MRGVGEGKLGVTGSRSVEMCKGQKKTRNNATNCAKGSRSRGSKSSDHPQSKRIRKPSTCTESPEGEWMREGGRISYQDDE